MARNVLFIMCDQLRWDYLSCAGHKTIRTPNIDALAKRGVQFSNGFAQGSVCGASRMSTYTGRYVTSHGASWNFVPLSVGQKTMGDHVRAAGVRCALVGKTHVEADKAGAKRLGMDTSQGEGLLAMHGGFEPYERDDGILPPGMLEAGTAYCRYLNEQGYPGGNPWHDFANSSLGADGELHSGWRMRWAREPARVKAEHSETPFMTDRAMDFIRETGDTPWLLHLSFIKPHWPYVAPAPYNDMYGSDDIQPLQRRDAERENAHPVYEGYMDLEISKSFSAEDVRQTVIPTYMGLITQVDDEIGRLMAFLDEQGRSKDTLIVFTADHGDYLGDHWLGDKELFHDISCKVPYIVVDPSREADATRGSVRDDLVEAIDLLPTFLDHLQIDKPSEWLEGRSLMPLLRDPTAGRERDYVVCENSYAFRTSVREFVGAPVDHCHMTMVRTAEWKYVYIDRQRPMLFDLKNDPEEYVDLGDSPAHEAIRAEMQQRLLDWLFARRRSPTAQDSFIAQWDAIEAKAGIEIGFW